MYHYGQGYLPCHHRPKQLSGFPFLEILIAVIYLVHTERTADCKYFSSTTCYQGRIKRRGHATAINTCSKWAGACV